MSSEEPAQLLLDLPDHLQVPTAEHQPVFRPIHYLGSKLRLAPVIAEALDDADGTRGAVLDLFAGSGATALAFAGHRQVFASDIQEYSRVLCSALLVDVADRERAGLGFLERMQKSSPLGIALRHAADPLIQFEQRALAAAERGEAQDICAVLEDGSLLAVERGQLRGGSAELQDCLSESALRMSQAGLRGSSAATVLRYFGGSYFSYLQAMQLDCLSLRVREFPAEFADFLSAAVLSTASDTVNTVGKQFAQPIRPRAKHGGVKRHLLSKINRDRRLDVALLHRTWLSRYMRQQSQHKRNVVARMDYRDALQVFGGMYSVVYADPPYTRDHYSRFYHVLETMALRDNPAVARSPGTPEDELSRGLYRDDRHQSPFSIKSQSADAFDSLFNWRLPTAQTLCSPIPHLTPGPIRG